MYDNSRAHQRLAMIYSHVGDVNPDKIVDLFPFMSFEEREKYTNAFQRTPSKSPIATDDLVEEVDKVLATLEFPLCDGTIPVHSMVPNPCLYNRYNYSFTKMNPRKLSSDSNSETEIGLISDLIGSKEIPLVLNFNNIPVEDEAFVIDLTEDYDANGLVSLLEEEFFAHIFITAPELTTVITDTIRILKELAPETKVVFVCGENQLPNLLIEANNEQWQMALKDLDIHIDIILANNTLVANTEPLL